MPRHIAVITDGNGRWARSRGLPRAEGHRAGLESVREVVEACGELGIGYLSLYTFSAENWQRPEAEVGMLMRLIEENLRAETERLHAKGVRLRLLGSREGLAVSLQAALREAEEMTERNTGLTLQLAINYGGRQEIVQAAAGLAREVASGRLSPDEIQESDLTRHLYLPDAPDPDLLIRSGGDLRVSNYLLWQIAYTEIHVTPVFWPDFRRAHLYEALLDYQGRKRRFGRVEDAR